MSTYYFSDDPGVDFDRWDRDMGRDLARIEQYYYYPACIERCDGDTENCGSCLLNMEICDRIGQYEDTGMTPEEIMEIRTGGWIRVEERLPEAFETVIVCRKNGKVEAGCRDMNGWWKVYGTRTKYVTHWMPLPLPPEEA